MIEIKGVRKEYISKRKEKKVALNNINIKFPDKGMCFILGETGSGKTTLLNLIGKLDTFNEGEIIVDGINIKSLSEKEANLYRSREIGFIFQEYNLIEEFDVYDNIALSCELQGKKVTPEEVKANLDSVNLIGYEKKMINELSGGEKQRVTIARALIKKPRLILADEPTGALDNKTGRQILDILKEISKEHLVIVVSHNEEYAKEYGDIIVRIEEGQVKEIIGSKKSELYQEEVKIKEEKEGKGLSNLKALKLGIKNLKLKVKRLILMVLVSSISFASLCITISLIRFDEETVFKNTIKEFNIPYMSISLPGDVTNITKNKYEKMKTEFPNCDFYGAYSLDAYLNTKKKFYAPSCAMEYNQKMFNDYGIELAAGKIPESDDEITISELLYYGYLYYGYNYSGQEVLISSYEDIINCTITMYKKEVKIVGIIKSDYSYQDFLKVATSLEDNADVYMPFDSDFDYMVFVNEGYFERNSNYFELNVLEKQNLSWNGIILFQLTCVKDFYGGEFYYKNDEEIKKLEGNQIILNYNKIIKGCSINYKKILEEKKQAILVQYAMDNYEKLTGFATYQEYVEYILNSFSNRYDREHNRDYFEEQAKIELINEILEYDNLTISYEQQQGEIVTKPVEIVGIVEFDDSGNYEPYYATSYISEELYDELNDAAFACGYRIIMVTYKDKLDELYSFVEANDKLTICNKHMLKIYETGVSIASLSTLFEIVGKILLCFSILLLLSYFVYMICKDQRKAGIYMLLGMRKSDLGKVYFFESGILMSVIFILSNLIGYVTIDAINDILVKKNNLQIILFEYSFTNFIGILLLIVVVLIISLIYPILRFLRISPIKALRG